MNDGAGQLNFLSRKRRWWIIPAVVILMVLAALVVRTAAILMLTPVKPELAAAIWPGPGEAIGQEAWMRYLQNDEIDQTAKDEARQALLRSPNLAQPFLLEALAAIKTGNPTRAGVFAAEAARRNPRSPDARAILASRLLSEGRVAEALPQIDRAMVLDRQLSDVMMPVLVSLTKSPKTLQPLVAYLARNPRWRSNFLQVLNTAGADPAVVFTLTNAGAGDASLAKGRSVLISTLIRAGDFDRAYLAWVNFLPPDMLGKVERVYDGKFTGLPGLPPFNWTFHSDEMGTADTDQGAGLRADYFGRDDAVFARQLLMLPPGAYRLSTIVTGDMHTENGVIGWQLRCVGPATTSAYMDLTDASERPTLFGVDLTVPPSGCPAQTLALIGTPGEFPKPSHVNITQVMVEAKP